jgi:cytochrome c-type biogenesis protein CcmE
VRRRGRFLIGGAVIAAAIGYLIYSGISQSVVYFVTPSELLAAPVDGKSYRLGGMVMPGSLSWSAPTLDLRFALSDGKATVPVRHKGAPPDLFAEKRGAVVEGAWHRDGYFQASLILAKHSEEYQAPHAGEGQPGYKELLRTLRGAPPDAAPPAAGPPAAPPSR